MPTTSATRPPMPTSTVKISVGTAANALVTTCRRQADARQLAARSHLGQRRSGEPALAATWYSTLSAPRAGVASQHDVKTTAGHGQVCISALMRSASSLAARRRRTDKTSVASRSALSASASWPRVHPGRRHCPAGQLLTPVGQALRQVSGRRRNSRAGVQGVDAFFDLGEFFRFCSMSST